MFQRNLLLVPVILALGACARTPAKQPAPNQYEHAFNYKYQPPPEVAEGDAEECSQRANDAAMQASSKVSDRAAAVFGGIGAIIQVTRIRRKLNTTYEKVMKACLREKGYEIPE